MEPSNEARAPATAGAPRGAGPRRAIALGRMLPVWAGAAGAAGLVALLILLVPDVRGWLSRSLVYPVAARVLGRDEILVEGTSVQAAPEAGVTAAFAVMVVLLLLAVRSHLMRRPGAALSRHVRVDTPLMLALVPYLALAPLLTALADLQLFHVPWAFFAVPPLVVVLIVAFVVTSFVFALWIEAGGRRSGPRRLLWSVVMFLFVGLAWIVVSGGTTTRLRWWIAVAAVVLIVAVHYGVTLGNRIHSHRRALFSLGCFHLAFFVGFLVLWFVQGPWPVQDWSLDGQEAVRELRPHADGALLLVLALGPPLLVATGAYTLGAFLHRYAAWARVWVDGLSLFVLFAFTLLGWVVTLVTMDPYGALDHTVSAPGPVTAWAADHLGGWGFFAATLILAVALVLAASLPRRMGAGRWLEFRTVLLGTAAGLAFVPGLGHALRLALGL